MSAASDLYTAISTAVAALFDDTDAAQLASAFDTRDQYVPRGETRFGLQAFLLPNVDKSESNVQRFRMQVRVSVHHCLGVGEAETTWANGDMQTGLMSLIDPSWWQALAGVYGIAIDPVGSALARVGNVVSFTVATVVSVAE